jgi:hypothetical protein
MQRARLREMTWFNDFGQQEGNKIEKPSMPKCLEGLRNSVNSTSSLAVFYVEQVALNRHVTPHLRLLHLCKMGSWLSR